MVHNGIEYTEMQAFAEVYDVLQSTYRLDAEEIANIFADWQDGELSGFLLDTAITVLRRRDGDTGGNLVDIVLDEAGQKGTGRWTAGDALRLGVMAAATSAAVDARILSSHRKLRQRASGILSAARHQEPPFDSSVWADLHDALLATRIVAFSQGFAHLAYAGKDRGWSLDLREVAEVWQGGCIIRARILEHIVDAFAADPDLEALLLEPWFASAINQTEQGWRRVVTAAVEDGVAVPVLSAALASVDGLRRERSPANLIQAMRDAFGSHRYRRRDRDGEAHTDWEAKGSSEDANGSRR